MKGDCLAIEAWAGHPLSSLPKLISVATWVLLRTTRDDYLAQLWLSSYIALNPNPTAYPDSIAS